MTNTTNNVANTQEAVKEYTDLIHTYGAATVILAVFIVGMMILFIYMIKSNQKQSNQLMKQQQQMLDVLIKTKEEVTTPQQQPKKEPDLVQVFLRINSSIKEILKSIHDELGTARIAVYVFHNGVYSSHGLPFFKTSCVCEIIRKNCGVNKKINTHTGLQLQLFDNSISHLYKHGKLSIGNVDNDVDEYDTPLLIGMLKDNGVKSGSGIAIYDHDNNIVGIMIAEFAEVHDKTFLEDIENKLVQHAPELSPILEYSGIYNQEIS